MTRYWIKAPGATDAAGPFTLDELRSLMKAGFLTPACFASSEAFAGFKTIAEWAEMTEALNSPGAKALKGEASLKLGERHVVPDTAGPESLAPAEKTSSLKLGRAAYDDTNAADKASALQTVEMLKANVDAEPEKALKFPPWYRSPFFRNLCRTIPFLLIGGPMIWFGVKGVQSGNALVSAFALGGGAMLIGAGTYFIWFVSPARWGMD